MKRILFLSLLFVSAYCSAQGPINDSTGKWRRFGYVTGDSLGGNYEAPSIKWEGSPVHFTGASKVTKMWFTSTVGGAIGIYYKESVDGVSNWWYDPTVVVAGHRSSYVFEFGGTYYIYAALGIGGTQIDQYTSTDGVTATLSHSAVITKGTTGTWNGLGVFNCAVDTIGTTWFMIVDGQSTFGFTDGVYTSTDGAGAVWTPVANNPVLPFLTSPFFKRVGSQIWVWGHTTGNNSILPTDGVRYVGNLAMTSFTAAPGLYTFHRETAGEGVNTQFGQIADLFLVQEIPSAGDTIIVQYNIATANGNNSGGAFIEASIFQGSWTQLVATNENASKYFQMEWSGKYPYYNTFLGRGTNAPLFPLDLQVITEDSAGATIRANNFVGGPLAVDFGFNTFYTGLKYRNIDSTQVGFFVRADGSGTKFYYSSTGTDPSPALQGGFIQPDSTFFVLGHILNGTATDDGSGNFFQGKTAEFTNVTLGTLNSLSISDGNGNISSNLQIGTTKGFGGSTVGSNNLAIQSFMNSLTSGSSDIGIGVGAGGNMTTGNFSTWVGTIAGQFATTVNFGSGFGRAAANNCTTCNEPTAFGANSLRAGTTRAFLSAFGGESFYQGPDGFASSGSIDTATCISYNCQIRESSAVVIGSYGLYKDRIGLGIDSPLAWLHVPAGLGIRNYGSIKIDMTPVVTTALAGNGTVMTFTYAALKYAPFMPGQLIRVVTAAPSGYIGTWTVSTSTSTSTVVSGTVTGSQTSPAIIYPDGKPTRFEPGVIGVDVDSVFFVDKDSNVQNLIYPSNRSAKDSSRNPANTAYVDASVAAGIAGITVSNPKVFSMTADGTVSNTSTPTTLIGTGIGSQTIAANTLSVGSVVTFKGSGTINTAVTAPSLSFNFVVGSSGNSISPTIGAALNSAYEFEMTGIVRTSGGSGTLSMTGWVSIAGTKTYIATGNFAINTTTGQLIDLVLTMSGTVGSGDAVVTKNSTIFVN